MSQFDNLVSELAEKYKCVPTDAELRIEISEKFEAKDAEILRLKALLEKLKFDVIKDNPYKGIPIPVHRNAWEELALALNRKINEELRELEGK